MKKTLLALAVLAAAGSAHAGINLYDANGVSVSLSGAAEVQYIKSYDEDQDGTLRLDDGDLALNTAVTITSQVDALAGIAFKFEADSSDENVTNDELWVGFGGDFGALTFGRQLMLADDLGNDPSYELGGDTIGFVVDQGDRVAKYVFDNGQFYMGANVLLKDADEVLLDDEIFGFRVGARFGDLDGRAYYQTTDGVDSFNVEVDYSFDAFAIAASYGENDFDDDFLFLDDFDNVIDSDLFDSAHAAIAGSYTMNDTTFALGYVYSDYDNADFDTSTIYANVTQQLHNNVKVYAEIGSTDIDDVDTDFGYLVGMEVKF